MNLRHLEAFVRIAKNKSFSQTAKELYLTQPTVSAYISRLESELGARLFSRTTKEVELTEEGRRLLPYAEEIAELSRRIEHEFQPEVKEEKNRIVLSVSSIPGAYLLPGILANFIRKNPGTEFRINETDSSGVVSDIAGQKADLGFAGTVIGSRNVSFIPFYEDELVIITPDSERYHRIPEHGGGLDWIRSEPWILREDGSGTLKETVRLLEERGIRIDDLRVVARLSNTGSILMSVREGLGIAVVSALAAEDAVKRGEILSFPLGEGGVFRRINMVVNTAVRQSDSCRKLMKYVKELYQ